MITREWGSVAEFIDYATGGTDMVARQRTSRKDKKGFHATASIEDAERIAFNWPDGVARVEAFRASLNLSAQRVRKTTVSREAGPGVLNMGKYVAGHPQPYVALVDSDRAARGKGKIVRILFNLCVSGGIPSSILEARGAGVLALADALEKAGRRVEITVGMHNAASRGMEYRILVKRAQQRLNLNTVAFAIANPDMFRRFIFSAMEREDAATRRAFGVGSGYGSVGEFRDHGADVYVGGALLGARQWGTPERAAAWVRETLAEQGVKIS